MDNLETLLYPIPGSEKEADIVIFTRRHWVSFLGQIFLAITLIIIPMIVYLVISSKFAVSSNFAHGLIVVGGGIFYLVIITFIFASWVTFYYDIYVLTKDEIVDINQQGFFGRDVSQLSLMRVQDVSSSVEGFLQTLFSYGDVIIETAGERSETFHIKSIPNPQIFSAKVLEMHNVLIESSGRKGQIMDGEGRTPPLNTGSQTQTMPTATQSQSVQEINQPIPQQDQEQTTSEQNSQNELPQINSDQPSRNGQKPQGEVTKDDLNKGGEVKF